MRTQSELSDGELIAQFKNGDAAAFDALVRRYDAALSGFLHHMVGDAALADDLFQETFLRILHSLPAYQERGRFKSWLFGVARNLAVDALRRHRLERELFHRPAPSDPDRSNARALDEGVADARHAPDVRAERAEWAERLQTAIAELPPEQREVVMLRYGAEMTFRQIAEITEVSINTALGRMRYATATLRRKLGVAVTGDVTDGTL